MKLKQNIQLQKEITPQIYAYTLPNSLDHQGWVKIGYTEHDVKRRVKEQTGTVRVKTDILWSRVARFNDEEYFRDIEFHNYLAKHNIERDGIYEWFYFGEGNEMQSEDLFRDFTFRDYEATQSSAKNIYLLREEQQRAVQMAYDYAMKHPGSEFLWNAKPRFGKTLSAYDLVRKMDAQNVLIVTNRPAIANSWLEDFEKFISWQTDFKFVSESPSLKSGSALSRNEFIHHSNKSESAKQINFLSLQDLKGSVYHGGTHDKLKWVSGIDWDILIIDEAHEGIDTFKTDYAFDNINRNFTLHLSGTPFNAIAKGDFAGDQIFNWSYQDEQEAKESWDEDSSNPYEELPKLNMFTYRMSNMITEEVEKGAIIDGDNTEYAFDLNEFFSTNNSGRFIYEEDVLKWLDTLTTNEKYPFSTEELRNNLKHSFWMLDRVDSAKALARILNDHNVFKGYEVVVAAGDGVVNEEDKMNVTEDSLHKVQKAIKENDKTITLSVGQLTTGVTIPQWSAVLMLSNIQSPALYMQAAFRAQNPWQWNDTINGKSVRLQKDNAYVFDFAPERTLITFDEFANNLNPYTASGGGTTKEREENIKNLLNFFPVIGEDDNGEMVELDFNDVITIPQQIKATEVVRRGFMSNFLFANIAGIFHAPQIVLDTLSELNPESEGRIRETNKKVDTKEIKLDEDNEPIIDEDQVKEDTKKIFGNKVYERSVNLPEEFERMTRDNLINALTDKITKTEEVDEEFDRIRKENKITIKDMNRVKKKFADSVKERISVSTMDANSESARIEKEFKEKVKVTSDKNERDQLASQFQDDYLTVYAKLEEEASRIASEAVPSAIENHIREEEVKKVTDTKNSVEEDVRSRLRGFARTIPSFIMAYGEEDLTLSNFDSYIPADVFKEVTGITIDQFRFLRDGGPYTEDGEEQHFEGQLFDEVVFNQSVQEFLNKRKELANYFENHEEDIFDYIPPQETNQIYTPKSVVQMMVDSLEEENPEIYNDSTKTFIDLYMKSGLYITEIVKKLFVSETLIEEFPDEDERIKHILENQVYGFAPSEIIYNIATNFIYGEFGDDISRKNFVQVDTVPYAQEGTMQELIDEEFGE